MNIDLLFDGSERISQILFPIESIGCNAYFNNLTYHISTKNIINFNRYKKIYIRFRVNDYEKSDVVLRYIIKYNIITIDDVPNKSSVLIIRNISDFDKITNKYGYIENKKDIVIDWEKLSMDYGGIDIYSSLKINRKKIIKERFEKCIYNNNEYTSWLRNEIFTDGGYVWNKYALQNIIFDNIGIREVFKELSE